MGDELKISEKAWDEFIKRRNPLVISAVKSFNHGLEHYSYRDKDDDRRYCLVEIDQAIELLLKGVLLQKGIKVTGDRDRFGYFDLLSKCKERNINIPEELNWKSLREQRNLIQHEGKVPDITHTEFFVNIATKTILELLKSEFKMQYNEIVKLIPHLLFLNIKTKRQPKSPDKPRIVSLMENLTSELFFHGREKTVLNLIVNITNDILMNVYEDKTGESGGDMFRTLDKIDFDFDKTKLPYEYELSKAPLTLQLSEIPFDVSMPWNSTPGSVYGLKICQIAREKEWFDKETCDVLNNILMGDILGESGKKLTSKFEPKVVAALFFFLKGLVFKCRAISKVIEEYDKEWERYFKNFLETLKTE